MPTPVATARQCLTDDATRALDDAVSVARRRSHSQTTSLHAVSALLALPLSSLREACCRARGSGYSPALQLRALELCVGVSLDRLPSGKSGDDDPPISNSLMAAIKRSQANQRRNPESFHLQQMHQSSQMTAPVIKVELKHYVLSILDDPIVSRVFGDAGYRSCDVKFGILHPPVSAGLRFARSVRCPPIFMMDSESSGGNNWRGFSFSLAGGSGGEDADGSCRRIGEVLMRKSGRNPLLIGACANDDLASFKTCVQRRKLGILPGEIHGLEVVCVADLVVEFVGSCGEGEGEERMRVKLKKELEAAVESSPGPGVVVNIGDLKVLIADCASIEAVSYLVSLMTDLLRRCHDRLWLIGAVHDDEMYKKLVAKYPALEVDWDLHLVPITSKPLGEGFGAKSGIMGSFVPFGGFFSNPSDYNPLSRTSQTTTRCQLCNEKYDQEVSIVLKGGGNSSIADQCSSSLPSWLQTNLDNSKEADVGKAQYEGTTFRAKILGVQKKWNEICQNLHPNHLSPKSGLSCSKAQSFGTASLNHVEEKKQSSSRDSSVSQSSCPNSSPSMATSSNKDSPKEIVEISTVAGRITHSQPEISAVVSTIKQLPVSFSQHRTCSSTYQAPTSSVIPVTTDLGLGIIYSSTDSERLHSMVTSVSKEFDTISPKFSGQLDKLRGSEPRRPVDMRDFKSLWKALIGRVSWQDEAISKISHCISRCRITFERRRSSNIWLSFAGHDRVGKNKIAAALAEAVTGSKQDLIYVNLGSQDGIEQSNSIFSRNEIKSHDIQNRGKTMADNIASKLSTRPNSVVFFENLDKADLLIQSSLSRAIKTAKFADSHGREVGLNNMIFIVSNSATSKNSEDINCGCEKARFCEENILEAKCWKLGITKRHVAAEPRQGNYKNVIITQPELRNLGKRKCDDSRRHSAGSQKAPRSSYLDLNLPAEELEEEFINEGSDSESASVSESSEAWLEEFCSEVDEKVTLKQYNFDALADKVLHSISQSFEKEFGKSVVLEIDHQAIVQILAASWLSDRTTAVDDWIKSVLNKSFLEARQRYSLTSQSVVQLISCQGTLMDDEAPDICLPSSILLN